MHTAADDDYDAEDTSERNSDDDALGENLGVFVSWFTAQPEAVVPTACRRCETPVVDGVD